MNGNLYPMGMRTGFACLFSGSPGTGKTETARQVAKATGRGIIQVDIADTKSKWFGESEKQIKAVFNRYRAAVKGSDVMPILLFNEADAVIGKRQELGTKRKSHGNAEATGFQTLVPQNVAVVFPVEDFEPVGNAVDENEKGAVERILVETVFDNGSETVEGFPHCGNHRGKKRQCCGDHPLWDGFPFVVVKRSLFTFTQRLHRS